MKRDVTPFDPLASDTTAALQAPSMAHWFGTDHLGRHVLSRVIAATRIDMGIALGAVLLSFAAGSLLGASAGYFGGWLDVATVRLIDALMAFPLFVLAMVIVAALGNTVENVIYATALVNLPATHAWRARRSACCAQRASSRPPA